MIDKIAKPAKPSAAAAKGVAKDLAMELDGVRREAVATLKADIDKTIADARDAVAQASAALGSAGQTLAEQAQVQSQAIARDARDRARSASDDLAREIRENPLTAVGAAAGIGLLLGLMLSRRN
jgi:ElaB/YqjD/DUF883 family membrane-anchored ribosome-binding protein